MKNSGIGSHNATAAIERESKKKTIVAPINIVSGPSEALEFAVELAQEWQANLYVMYVYSELPRVSGPKLIHALHSVDWDRHRRSFDLNKLVDRIRERYPQTFAYFAGLFSIVICRSRYWSIISSRTASSNSWLKIPGCRLKRSSRNCWVSTRPRGYSSNKQPGPSF